MRAHFPLAGESSLYQEVPKNPLRDISYFLNPKPQNLSLVDGFDRSWHGLPRRSYKSLGAGVPCVNHRDPLRVLQSSVGYYWVP